MVGELTPYTEKSTQCFLDIEQRQLLLECYTSPERTL